MSITNYGRVPRSHAVNVDDNQNHDRAAWRLRKTNAKHAREIDNKAAEAREESANEAQALNDIEFNKMLNDQLNILPSSSPINSTNIDSKMSVLYLTQDISEQQWATLLSSTDLIEILPELDELIQDIQEIDDSYGSLGDFINEKLEGKLAKRDAGQVFIALEYIRDKLKKLVGKHNEEMDELVEEYSKENFEYLAGYLASTDDSEDATAKASHNGVSANSAALLKTGKLVLDNVRNVIAFVGQEYKGKKENLMSLLLRIKATQLDKLTHKKYNLARYRKLYNEILAIRATVQSYAGIDEFAERLKRQNAMVNNNERFLLDVFSFLEMRFVTEFAFSSMFRNNLSKHTLDKEFYRDFHNFIMRIPIVKLYGDSKLPEIKKFLKPYLEPERIAVSNPEKRLVGSKNILLDFTVVNDTSAQEIHLRILWLLYCAYANFENLVLGYLFPEHQQIVGFFQVFDKSYANKKLNVAQSIQLGQMEKKLVNFIQKNRKFVYEFNKYEPEDKNSRNDLSDWLKEIHNKAELTLNECLDFYHMNDANEPVFGKPLYLTEFLAAKVNRERPDASSLFSMELTRNWRNYSNLFQIKCNGLLGQLNLNLNSYTITLNQQILAITTEDRLMILLPGVIAKNLRSYLSCYKNPLNLSPANKETYLQRFCRIMLLINKEASQVTWANSFLGLFLRRVASRHVTDKDVNNQLREDALFWLNTQNFETNLNETLLFILNSGIVLDNYDLDQLENLLEQIYLSLFPLRGYVGIQRLVPLTPLTLLTYLPAIGTIKFRTID